MPVAPVISHDRHAPVDSCTVISCWNLNGCRCNRLFRSEQSSRGLESDYMATTLVWMLVFPFGAAVLAALHFWRMKHRNYDAI